MSRNPILDELHAARQKLLEDAGNDLHRYVEGARQSAELGPPDRRVEATNKPLHRSGEIRRFCRGQSIVAAR